MVNVTFRNTSYEKTAEFNSAVDILGINFDESKRNISKFEWERV